jgi:hypothetical protein
LPQLHDLTQLTAHRGDHRLSVFLPLSSGTAHATRTRVRTRKILRRAGQALRRDGMRPAQADAVTEAAAEIVEDWSPRSPSTASGLALFVSPDEVHHFQVPIRLPELAVLGDRFTVGPLLPLFTVDGSYFVLALSQDDVGLFQGPRRGTEQVELSGYELAAWASMPPRRPAQVHAFIADRGGARSRAVFHGVGAGMPDDRKALIARHFRGVDHALREVLPSNGQAPLVLAAVRSMQSLYREINTYPHLIGQGIDGSPRDLAIETLHRRAWPLVEPALRRTEEKSISRYEELHGTGHTVDGPTDTLAAAEHGQVQSLLLCADAPSWSDFPNDDGVARLSDGARVEEKVELAALATLHHAGDFFVVPAERMPGKSLLAATLRFPPPVPPAS